MKKKMSTESSVETHSLISRQFPAGPGSDLVNTNAIPYEPVPDVDFACGHEMDECSCGHQGRYHFGDGHYGHLGQHSFAVVRKEK